MGPLWGAGRLYAITRPMSTANHRATQVASFVHYSRGIVHALHARLTEEPLNYFLRAEKFN